MHTALSLSQNNTSQTTSLPLISLTKQYKPDNISTTSLVSSTIYEENSACIVLATTEANFKLRTKRIALKFHHFKDKVSQGCLQIVKVDTDMNITDIFTKPLAKHKFKHLLALVPGW
jgi:hypothetical protein